MRIVAKRVVAERFNDETCEWEAFEVDEEFLSLLETAVPLNKLTEETVSIGQATAEIASKAFCQINGIPTETEKN